MSAELESLGSLFNRPPAKPKPKAPSYEWQDLALKIIGELHIPNFKRNSVFKICRDYDKITIERAMNDTKELCQSGEAWKYFFKIIAGQKPKQNSAK